MKDKLYWMIFDYQEDRDLPMWFNRILWKLREWLN
jgi:hypothetical protein